MMSLDELYALLESCDDVDGSDRCDSGKDRGGDLDWLWHVPGADAFLRFVCSKVTRSCLVSASEWKRFNELQRRGHILEGKELERALESCTINSQQHLQEEDDLRSRIPANSIDHARLERQQRALISCLSECRLEHGRCVQQVRNSQMRVRRSTKELDEVMDASNQTVAEIATLTQQLSLYKHTLEKQTNAIKQYHDIDDGFTKQIRMLFDQLIVHRNSAQQAEESSRSGRDQEAEDGADESGKSSSSQAEYEANVAELKRLRGTFAESERQRIEALVELERAKAVVAALEQHQHLEHDHCSADDLHRLHARKCSIDQQIQNLKDNVLSSLYKQLAKLQPSTVLQGDYELKIQRQQRGIERQRLVLAELLRQRAGHEIVQAAIQNQIDRFNEVQEIISEVHQLLETHRDEVAVRMTEYERVSSRMQIGAESGRRTLDARDEFGNYLDAALQCATNAQSCDVNSNANAAKGAFVTFEGMHMRAKQLEEAKKQAARSRNDVEEREMQNLRSLREEASALESLLSYSSTTDTATLSDQSMVAELQQLQSDTQRLKEQIYALQMDEASKRKTIQQSEQRCGVGQREIFVKFFTDPDALEAGVRELAERAELQLPKDTN